MNKYMLLLRGLVAVLPLSIAVIPWGILAGSFAIDIGMTPIESQAMSLFVFAGSAQLVATGMLKAGTGIAALLLTVFFISARHLLYGISMRNRISQLPGHWRFSLGFLLTDELFALCQHQTPSQFNRWYALGVGLGFYIVWNLSTLAGIILGAQIPDLDKYGLEFAVAATFIAIIVPMIVKPGQFACVIAAAVLSIITSVFNIEGGLIISSLIGMFIGYMIDRSTSMSPKDNSDVN